MSNAKIGDTLKIANGISLTSGVGDANAQSYIYNAVDDKMYFRFKDESGNVAYTNMAWIYYQINTLLTSFQDGCNSIVSKCTALGVTPSSNSPADICNAIHSIADTYYSSGWNGGYNSGYDAGVAAVKANPSSFGITQDIKHTVDISGWVNAGPTAGVKVKVDGSTICDSVLTGSDSFSSTHSV